jgi:hypothetical protein
MWLAAIFGRVLLRRHPNQAGLGEVRSWPVTLHAEAVATQFHTTSAHGNLGTGAAAPYRDLLNRDFRSENMVAVKGAVRTPRRPRRY